MIRIDRRRVLVAGAGLVLAAAAPAMAELVVLPVGARKSSVTVWAPKTVRGVVLFGTGHGSWPDRYAILASRLVGAGFAVAAPLHVDSVQHPDREKFSFQASFAERRADMKALSAYAAQRWPGVPVAAGGHSFGSLIALCLGGGLANIGPFRDPSVKAVLGFSTPGKIPGLVQPQAYAGLAVPTFIVTGDRDTVPGFVANPADHLFPVESAPAGGKTALVIAGATHDLVGGNPAAAFISAATHATDFLKAELLDDRAARTAFASAPETLTEHWIRR